MMVWKMVVSPIAALSLTFLSLKTFTLFIYGEWRHTKFVRAMSSYQGKTTTSTPFEESEKIAIIKKFGFALLHAGLPGHLIKNHIACISDRFQMESNVQIVGNTMWYQFNF